MAINYDCKIQPPLLNSHYHNYGYTSVSYLDNIWQTGSMVITFIAHEEIICNAQLLKIKSNKC